MGGGRHIKVHNNYNATFVGHLSNHMSQVDLGDNFHLTYGHMFGQIPSSCSIIYIFAQIETKIILTGVKM